MAEKQGSPSTRVQRTRLRSPLTRSPLGGARPKVASALVFYLTFAGAPGNSREAWPKNWKVYENRRVGISIRYPPLMTVHTGDDAKIRGFIPTLPKPDVRIAFPVSAFKGTTIDEAAVAIYADGDDYWCTPREGSAAQALAGRPFYHYEDGDAAGGHTLEADCFSTIYRGKCFTIMTVVQRFRYDGESPAWVEQAEKRLDAITLQLMQVVRTLALRDPSTLGGY